MLRIGGAETRIFGFHRARSPDVEVADRVVDLGRTVDAGFAQRIWAVACAIPRIRKWAGQLAASDIILARNLEMLLLATIAQRRYAPHAPLVYECLDIHRLMLSTHGVGAMLRVLEGFLLSRCRGLMVSSPGFVREYFARAHTKLPKTFVVENKAFVTSGSSERVATTAPPGPPWRIGWFGVLRCRRSLQLLSDLVRSAPGLVEVVAAGLPAPSIFPDAEKAFEGIPGFTYLGPYKDEAELSRHFRSVHLTWAIDFYESGGNSDWLLPNRLYRAILYGAVPLALTSVETGKWLAGHDSGMLLSEPIEAQLADVITNLTQQSLLRARAALERIPTSALVTDEQECQQLVRAFAALGSDSAVPNPRRLGERSDHFRGGPVDNSDVRR
jgi:succinoglycan biosynthesis protein ExoL